MKKLILVQAILLILFCQYSSAFPFQGTMDSLAAQIYTSLTNQEASQNELYGSDGMTKLAQQIKIAAEHKRNGTTPLRNGSLMGVRNPNSNQSNEKAIPEDKMSKLAKAIMSAFKAQDTNQTVASNNSTAPVQPIAVPNVQQNTSNTTNVTQNTTVAEPVVIVETNKTHETNQTVQNNTEPVIENNTTVTPVVENNNTQETNQTAQINQTTQPAQGNETNQTTTQAAEANQTKPSIPPVHSTQPIGIEKIETPKLEVEAECGNEIEHSLAAIYNLGVHAAARNAEKIRRDYEVLKNITIGLNRVCYKSFSINLKPRPFFNNTGVCESELKELQKLVGNFNENSKDMISFAKTLQNIFYRQHNFVASCISIPIIGIEKTEVPTMKVEEECAEKIEHSLAIIYDLGVHSAARNVEKVTRDYDALKNITVSLNKVCSKSFFINMKPHPFFNNTGVCESELSELQKLSINYSQNSKDKIYFAKTLQNFWYRHINFVSSCVATPNIGIEKIEVPAMKVEDECAEKIERSLAIIYNLGVHSAAQNVDKVRRDYEALENITVSLNKVCAKSFSINVKPRPFFNNTRVCQAELTELQKLAINYNQNSKDKISFAKTLQNFWYRHGNFVSSCLSSPVVGIEKTETPTMKVEDECAERIEHSLAIIYNLGVHSAAQNVDKVRRDYEALKNITMAINKACSKSFSINVKPHPFFNNTGVCQTELTELHKLAINYNQNSKDKISFAKTLQNFWYRNVNFVSSCVENTTTKQSQVQTNEQRETNCILSFAEAISAINKMNGNLNSWNPSATKTLINNLQARISNINKFCDAKFFINVVNSAQGNCQKSFISLKSEVEKFIGENSKDLNLVSEALRQISAVGQQVLNSC